MGTGIRVTPEQLVELATAVAQGSAQIDGTLGGMSRRLAPVAGGAWAGAAAGQFTTLWQEWQRSAASLNQALEGISHLLGQAGQAYAHAEQQIAGSFHR